MPKTRSLSFHGHGLRLLLMLATGAITAGCASSPPPSSHESVEFLEAVSVPVLVDSSPAPHTDGGVVSVRIGAVYASVVVTNVTFISDPGLDATYLGFTDCRKGCPGAQRWDPEGQSLALGGLLGRLPFPVPVEYARSTAPLSVVLRLAVPSAQGVSRLMSGCLYVHAARVTLSDGTQVTATAPGRHWIAAIELNPPPSKQYQPCKM